MGIAIDPDFLLIQKMRMGDDKAIETFVRKYYPSILKYCQTHVSDHSYAEALTQDTFARFFRSFDQYRRFGKEGSQLPLHHRLPCMPGLLQAAKRNPFRRLRNLLKVRLLNQMLLNISNHILHLATQKITPVDKTVLFTHRRYYIRFTNTFCMNLAKTNCQKLVLCPFPYNHLYTKKEIFCLSIPAKATASRKPEAVPLFLPSAPLTSDPHTFRPH